MGVRRPTKDELKLLDQCYCPGEDIKAEDFYVIDADSATSNVRTAYHSYLTKRSIQNFVMDVNGKVRSLDAPTIGYYLNHDVSSRPPMGGCFDAVEVEKDKELTFRHKIFLPSGYTAGDVNVDDYVKSVKFRMSEQVSVGFVANVLTCRICQNDIRSAKCSHWPGIRYNVGTEDEPKFEICTYDIDDAHLNEVSAAWKGALPGARIVMSEGGASANETPNGITNVKAFPEGSTLKFSLNGDGRIEMVTDSQDGGRLMHSKDMDTPAVENLAEESNVAQEVLEEPTALANCDANILTDEVDNVATMADELAEQEVDDQDLEFAVQKIEELMGELAMVKAIVSQYQAEVVGDIHKLTVGIDSSLYDKDQIELITSRLTLDELKKYRDSLRGKLAAAIPTGRLTQPSTPESAENPGAPRLEDHISRSAYRVGR